MLRKNKSLILVLIFLGIVFLFLGCDYSKEYYTLTIEVLGEGLAEPHKGSAEHLKDSIIEIKAIPAVGWEFSHWEGSNYVSENAKNEVLMNKNKGIKAVFVEEGLLTDLIIFPVETKLEVGENLRLKTKIRGETNFSDIDFFWESNNEDIVLVDDTGMVTALARGKAEITASLVKEGLFGWAVVVVGESDDDNFQTLKPGGLLSGIDGVKIAAPVGVISGDIEISIELMDDPALEVPFPVYFDNFNQVGKFYGLSASLEVNTYCQNYLLMALPVPEDVCPDQLVVAVMTPIEAVRLYNNQHYEEIDPSYRWNIVRGAYDPESNLFGTLVSQIDSDPLVYTLMEGIMSSQLEVQAQNSSRFLVETFGFDGEAQYTQEHINIVENALNEAYDVWVKQMGFNEPRLKHVLMGITVVHGLEPSYTLLDKYEFGLRPGLGDGGGYNSVLKEGFVSICFRDLNYPKDYIIRHEFFHALQYGYPETFKNFREWVHGIDEGTAVMAEMSLHELTRSPTRAPMPISERLFFRSGRGFIPRSYQKQDFFVYLGKRFNPENSRLDFLIPLFEAGGQLKDLDQMIKEEGTFDSLSAAYWSWVKNQAFEKRVILGVDEEGNNVPHGDVGEWSEHGSRPRELSILPDNTETRRISLSNLRSEVFRIIFNRAEEPYLVKAEIANREDFNFKFYDEDEIGREICWDESCDNEPRIFCVKEPIITYLLVSHLLYSCSSYTHTDFIFSPLSFEFAEIPIQKADALFDITLTLTDPEGNAVSLNEPVMLELSVLAGTGNLAGNLIATIEIDESQIVFEGLTYDIPEDNIVLQAEIISGIGEGLTFLSNPFDVSYLQLQFEDIEEQEVDVPFAVTVTSVDKKGNILPVREDVTVTLSVNGGTGNLTGEIIGMLKKGESQLIFADITYDKSEYQIYLIAEAVSENIGTSIISSNMFDVTGFDFMFASIEDQKLDIPFAVKVYSLDKLGNIYPAREEVTIKLSVIQGTGNLSGVLVKTLKKGETQLVFDNLIYDKAEEDVWILAEVIDGFAIGRVVFSNFFNVFYSLPDQFQILFDVEVYLTHPDVEYMEAHHRQTINIYQREEGYVIKEPDFYYNPSFIFNPLLEADSIIYTGTGSLSVESWDIGSGTGPNKDYITGRSAPVARQIKIVLGYKEGNISLWFIIETPADVAFYYQYGWPEDPFQTWTHEWNIHTSYSEAYGLKDWEYNTDNPEIIAILEELRIDSHGNEVTMLIEVCYIQN